MDPEISQRVALKITKVGYCRVHAPTELIAHQWAREFDQRYEARVEEGIVDHEPAWLVVVEARPEDVPAAAVG
jgi:hypothetical protein